jgi:hypothetical protein
VLNHGHGRFAEPAQRQLSTVAEFLYRFLISEQFPYLQMALDSFARPPLAPPPRFFSLQGPAGLSRPVAASSGILVVRAPGYELRGHVRSTTTTTIAPGPGWYVTVQERFECIECSQRGIPGDADEAEARLRRALQAFRGIEYYSIDSQTPKQYEFTSPDGGRFFYGKEGTHRQGDEIVYRRYPPYVQEGDPVPVAPGPEVPESLQFFPLSDG